MYCFKCNYDLRGSRGRACPECGRTFDPDDPATFRHDRQHHVITARVLRIIVFFATGAQLTAVIVASALAVDPMRIGSWICVSVLPAVVLLPMWVAFECLAHRHRLVRHLVCFAVLAILVLSVPFTSWPLRISFAAHRPAMDKLANDQLDGTAASFPAEVGLFTIDRGGYAWYGNVYFSLDAPGTFGAPAFYRVCDPDDNPVGNINLKVRLTDHWYFITTD